jgi:hypothetical protein
MRFWTRTLPAVAIVWCALFVDHALGQVQLTQAAYMGKVVGVRGTDVLLKSNNGISVIASLSPERRIGGVRVGGLPAPNVEVTGTLHPDHLQKGMCVRFLATVEGQTRRTVTEPVKELNVFTPDQTTRFGLLSDGVGVGGPEAGKAGGPQTYLVVGPITSVRGGMITVEFPAGTAKGSVRARIADDAVINLKSDKLYAPPGADVTVEGVQVQGAAVQPVQLLATSLKIRLPPPPPPKSKIARAPGADARNDKSGQGDAFAPQNAGEAPENAGEDGAEPGGIQKAKVPGKIVKVN